MKGLRLGASAWVIAGALKPGLRLQILLLLGGLLLLAFVPLFFAVATYASLTLQRVRENHARSLARAVAAQIAEARTRRPPDELLTLLDAQVGTGAVVAVGVYDPQGRAVARAGDPSAVDALAAPIDPAAESMLELPTAEGRALAVAVPGPLGPVVAVLGADDGSARAAPLVRLVGLYTGVVALALLLLAYFALTRLIVRPLDDLSRAARRVASGARRLEVPRTGARELYELGASVRSMTENLIREEEALRKKVEEVELATRRLEEAQQRLIRSERLASVGRLAAGLAHEIGNPIAALLGMQDLLLTGDLEPAEQKDFLQRMRKETERIHHILRDLLQFARPSAGVDGTAPAPGNVEASIYDTVALLSPQSAMKDVELAVDVYPELPEVTLPGTQLVQVILNLVLNAADAVGAGGHVTLRARPTDAGVRLEVEDDGPGVAPEILDRLFEPFVTSKEVGRGTGLGLAVCRGLVEAVGGTIALDPSYLKGARFSVELPQANDPD
jgi:two-component system, NtrC family, sensor kinase